MLEGAFIVKATEVLEPDDGTLPVPIHPVHTYLVPAEPAQGDVTEAVMLVPASNHSEVGVGES